MAEDQTRSLQDKFMLRLPDGMRERLKHVAMENKRSLNAEIVARIEESLKQDAVGVHIMPDGKMQEIVERAVRRVLAEPALQKPESEK